MTLRIVVVGGVAAGASAAAKARRENEFAEIIMLEKGEYVSYANCGIPYYLSGDINKRDHLFLVTPERFRERFNIDVRIRHEVTKVNASEKRVEGTNHATGESFRIPYDKLILATGGTPIIPPVPGVDLQNIVTLWTVPDVDKIKTYVGTFQPEDAVVVGGGFVGLEAVEALLNVGVKVTLIERLNQVMPPLDSELAGILSHHLAQKGVRVILGNGVAKFNGRIGVEEVELADGQKIPTDLVIMAVGVKPMTDLAVDAGLQLGETGGVLVNERMETSVPDIYAAGDIVESVNLITGQKVRLPLAGPANKQGRVAGTNAAGGNKTFKGVLGSMIVKVCELVAAKTGLNEREALELGLDHFVVYTHPADHAGYYPGAQPMVIKLVVDKSTGRVLGGQIVGSTGVDKRIDVLATAIYGKMTVEDLEDLDLAYAPPFSSAKDPNNLAGMVAANIWRGEMASITPQEVATRLEDTNFQVVDVRTPQEYQRNRIPGAVNLPLDDLRQRWRELDLEKETVVYCGVAYRSYLAYRILKQQGFKQLKNMTGGFNSWQIFQVGNKTK